jgi:hypothetical protein
VLQMTVTTVLVVPAVEDKAPKVGAVKGGQGLALHVGADILQKLEGKQVAAVELLMVYPVLQVYNLTTPVVPLVDDTFPLTGAIKRGQDFGKQVPIQTPCGPCKLLVRVPLNPRLHEHVGSPVAFPGHGTL